LTATKEVILSAGSIGSPHLLLLSGIGERNTLKALNITSFVDLPDVGKNLSDHPTVGNVWLVNSTNTFETAARNSTIAQQNFQQWNQTKTGLLTKAPSDHIGWIRLPGNATIFDQVPDPAAGNNSAHFELIFLVSPA